MVSAVSQITHAIADEMVAQPEWIQNGLKQIGVMPLQGQNDLEKQGDLLRKISPFCSEMDFSMAGSAIRYINSPEVLQFLLASSEKLPKSREIQLAAVGRLFALGEVNNPAVLAAWSRFKGEWQAMDAPLQVQSLYIFGDIFSVVHRPLHPALPLIKEFLTDRGIFWRSEGMRQASLRIVEAHVSNTKTKTVWKAQDLMIRMCHDSLLSRYQPLLKVYDDALLKLDASFEEFQVKHLRVYLEYLEEKMQAMSCREQIRHIQTIGRFLDPIKDLNHPVLSVIRSFLADKTVAWANKVLSFACSHVVEYRVKELRGHQTKLGSLQMYAILEIFKKMEKETRDLDFAALNNILACTNNEQLKDVLESYKDQHINSCLSSMKEGWNRMSLIEQAKSLWTLGELLATITNLDHPILPELREFLADDSFVWANPEMQRAASFVFETTVSALQGKYDKEANERRRAIIDSVRELSKQ